MFKCDECKKTQAANTDQRKVVRKARKKYYTNRIPRGENFETKETVGWEIAEESSMCAPCAGKYANMVTIPK